MATLTTINTPHRGCIFAEYLLGKLLWEGADVPQDKEQAIYWLGQAADQGHSHAQLLLERQGGPSLPSAILAVKMVCCSRWGASFRPALRLWTAPAASTPTISSGAKFRRRKSLWAICRTIMRSRIMLAHPCDFMQNLRRSKQYVTHPSVDNFLITRSKSNGYSRPLVVWCVTAKEGEHYAKNSGKALLR